MTFALSLDGAEAFTQFGQPTATVNRRPLIRASRENGSFAVHIGRDAKLVPMASDPATFWQTPH